MTSNNPNRTHDSVVARISAHVRAGESVCIGLSGGLDSMVLLEILSAAGRALGIHLSAIHVHHGLSPNADAWTFFCEAQCVQRSIPLSVIRVNIDRHSGLGIEAAARDMRYASYAEVNAQWIALAHHADDVAETILLRLLRGTGIKGLAAMREIRPLTTEKNIIRPMLGMHRSNLEHFASEHALKWIEDESNNDTRFERNFLRREILPRLTTRFPAAVQSILRAGEHAREAQNLLDDLARLDLQQAGLDDVVPLPLLRALGAARAGNVLRFFLAAHGAAMPDSSRLEEAVRQILECSDDAQLLIEFGPWELRRHRETVVLVATTGQDRHVDFECPWNGTSELKISELGGKLCFTSVAGEGIRLRLGREPGWVVRPRTGGERMRPKADRPTRTLKNLFQEQGIPSWERDRLPLLFHRDRLVWVPGIGIDCAYQCSPDDDGLVPRWEKNSVG